MTEYEQKFYEKTGQIFKNYYKETLPRVSFYLTRYTKNYELAEEFANMAFVQGLEKIDTYNPELSKFITWLTSIAVNLVIKDYKDRKKFNLVSIDEELSENLRLSTLLKNEEENDLIEENKLKCEIIKDVINSLPDKYKKVMIMRELDKKPYKEIAELIKKEQKVSVTYGEYCFSNTSDFYSFDITNCGDRDVYVDFIGNSNDNTHTYTIYPSENKKIDKYSIKWESIEDGKISVNSKESTSNINYIQTTNLSTIKSQIKKGRTLIKRKVKKDFELIDKNGI